MTKLPLDIPLNDFHLARGAKMISFAGYNMPINYSSGIINEHNKVRTHCGIFDVSHMGQILIPSSNYNICNLEKYIPLNLKKLKSNKSNYSFLLNEKGGIIDDIIISNINLNKKTFFYIVYNASRKNHDENIFTKHTKNYKILKKNCLFAIQGPEAYKVLNKVIKIPNNIHFLDFFSTNIKLKNVLITRTGYTGEDGFEISIPIERAENFLKKLLEDNNSILCGLGSRDSLRVEAGLSLYGHELNEDITPIEAGLLWALDKERLNDNNLNGNKELFDQLCNQPAKKKIGIKMENRTMIREGMTIVNKNNDKIGIVTSGCFSPTLNKSIGLGYISSDYSLSNEIFCKIRDKLEVIKISNLPFVKKNYNKGAIK